MKKLMFAIAAVAAGTVLADVTSANIVGYQSQKSVVAQNGNFILVSPGFFSTADGTFSTDQIGCSKAIYAYDPDSGEENPGWLDDCAQFAVPNGFGSYAWRYYIADAEDTTKTDTFVPGWANDMAQLEVLEADIGVGVWLKGVVGEETTFTLSGAVDDQTVETVERETPINFELVANPFPVDFDITKATWDIAAIYAYDPDSGEENPGWMDECAQLSIPNGYGSYAWRYYIADAEDTTKTDTFVPGWANDMAQLEGITVPAGVGFWVKRCTKAGESQAWSFQIARPF